jgi:hypothetical protein
MTSVPPDPTAAEEAELRSEDDGMPVHPAKSANPAGYAADHDERERAAAAGYPTSPIWRACADMTHSVTAIVDELLAPKNRTVVTVAGLIGFGLTVVLLERIVIQPRLTRQRLPRW